MEIARRLNESDDVRAQRIRFEPLLWEDLPPGPADDGGYQARIERLLKRHDLKTFQVYVGFMKDRVGTPTERYPSGTVAEFEDAMRRQRRTGLPAEVLFYFLRGEAERTAGVSGFARELEQRRFLFGVATTDEIFAARVEEHLRKIAREWFHVGNRIVRQARSLRRATGVLAATLLLAWLWFDLGGAWRIDRTLHEAGPRAAAAAWQRQGVYMPLLGARARAQVNRAMADSIARTGDPVEAFEAFAAWRATATYAPADARTTQDGVAAALNGHLAKRALDPSDARSAIVLWRRATDAGVWSVAADAAVDTVRLLAAKRLLQTMLSESVAPQTWLDGDLRPFERQALASYAGAVAQQLDLADWGGRRQALLAALLLEDWPALGRLAESSFRTNGAAEQLEIAALVRRAPAPTVVRWLDVELRAPDVGRVPSHVVARVVDAVRERDDADVTLALLDAVASPEAPPDARDMLEGLSCPRPGCVAGARSRLLAWARADTPMPREVLLVLLEAADVGALPAETRAPLAARLLALPEPEPVVLRNLAELRDPVARRFLDDRIQRHVTRAISFAVAERSALIAGLAYSDRSDRFSRARRMVEASLQDTAERRNFAPGFDAGAVYAAYLTLLVEDRGATWSAHRTMLEQLLAWRAAEGSDSFSGPEFDDALGRLAASLPPGALVSLLAYPRAPTLDPPWSPMWDMRVRLLRAIVRATGRLPEGITSLVAANLPQSVDETLPDARRQGLESLMATAGGAEARRFFRDELASGRKDALRLLAENGDVDTVRRAITASAPPGFSRAELIDAIDRLSAGDARALLPLLVGQPGASADADVWSAAGRAELDHPELKRAAAAEIAAAEDAQRVAAALRYLGAVAPEDAWQALRRPDVLSRVGALLAALDVEDWEAVTQELPEPSRGVVPESFAHLATSRIVLSVRDGSCGDGASGCFPIGGRVVFELPLLAYARGGENDAALATLSALASTTTPVQVETDASVEDPGGLIRAYAQWLAADVVQRADGRAPEPVTEQALLELDAANPRTSRAAASLVLATSRATLASIARRDPLASDARAR